MSELKPGTFIVRIGDLRMNELKPGSYRLTRDIPAPCPDKRKRRDWRAAPVEKGTIMRVKPWSESLDPTGQLHIWTGPWSHMSVPLRDFPVDALEPIEESPSQWLRREHSGLILAASILDELAKRGIVTLEQIQQATDAVLNDDG